MTFFGQTRQCYHQTGTWTDGHFTKGTPTSFIINASIQNATPAQLDSIPEVKRKSGAVYTVITYDILLVTNGNTLADLVVYESKNFEVVSQLSWANNLLNHNIYLIQELTAV